MVTKIVNADNVGDLRNAGDYFGVEDDRIYVQAVGGPIYAQAGHDIVDASNAPGAPQVAYLGSGNDEYYGGVAGVDTVSDGDGSDFLSLGGGDDNVYAGAGQDTYIGGGSGSIGDTIFFSRTPVNDDSVIFNYSGVVFDLAKTTAQNLGVFGTDTVTGFENIEGSYGNDKLLGSAANNRLQAGVGNDFVDGRAGADFLFGNEGSDFLVGGAGNDYLGGGQGADVLNGGAGRDSLVAQFQDFTDTARDRFVYAAIADSGTTLAKRDDINGFTHSAGATGDRIDLHRIDADPSKPGNQAFKFGTSFHAKFYGEVRVINQGVDTVVLIDIDKDAQAEMSILVQGVTNMQAYDFIL